MKVILSAIRRKPTIPVVLLTLWNKNITGLRKQESRHNLKEVKRNRERTTITQQTRYFRSNPKPATNRRPRPLESLIPCWSEAYLHWFYIYIYERVIAFLLKLITGCGDVASLWETERQYGRKSDSCWLYCGWKRVAAIYRGVYVPLMCCDAPVRVV